MSGPIIDPKFRQVLRSGYSANAVIRRNATNDGYEWVTLGSAAYQPSSAFDTAGAASSALASANAYSDSLVPSQTGNTGKYLTTNGTSTAWGTVTQPTAGNPSDPAVNLTGSNGTATTFMRSDAVLKLDQGISPTWTGQHVFNAAGPTVVKLIVKGASSQDANITEWKDYTGAVQSAVTAGGYFTTLADSAHGYFFANSSGVIQSGLYASGDTPTYVRVYGAALMPSANLTGALGDPSFRWLSVYSQGGDFTGSVVCGSPDIGTAGLTVNTVSLQTANAIQVFAPDGTTLLASVDSGGYFGTRGVRLLGDTTTGLFMQAVGSMSMSSSGISAFGVQNNGLGDGAMYVFFAGHPLGQDLHLNLSYGGSVALRILTSSDGTKIATSTSQKLAFWAATPVAQQVLATGAGHGVDDVIGLLQTLGLCRQS